MGEAPDDYVAWVSAAQQGLLKAAYLVTGSQPLAEDLVQEALIKVGQRWHRLHDQQPTAYARRIIHRDHVSWWRHTRRERLDASGVGEGAAPPRDSEQGLVLRDALARLSHGQRAVIVLRYLDDLTERETAEVLGVSIGTVKSQAYDALRRLRQLVETGVLERDL